jgi:hypothetical protein
MKLFQITTRLSGNTHLTRLKVLAEKECHLQEHFSNRVLIENEIEFTNLVSHTQNEIISEELQEHISEINFQSMASLVSEVHGEVAVLALLFGAASVIRRKIIETTGFFPLLNIYGNPASGKTSLADAINRLFYANKSFLNPPFPIKNLKKISETSNESIIVIDDFYEDNDDYRLNSTLKKMYDNQFFQTGSLDSGIEKRITPLNYATIISSCDKIKDVGLQSRTIPVHLEFTDFSKYQELKHLLLSRTLGRNDFYNIRNKINLRQEEFSIRFNALYPEIKEILASRIPKLDLSQQTSNIAVLMTMYKILRGAGIYNIEIPTSFFVQYIK